MPDIKKNLNKRIMRRVYTLYVISLLKTPISQKICVLLTSFLSLSYLVSLRSIIHNMPSSYSPVDHFYFYERAFFNTELFVKTAFSVFFVVTIFLLLEIFNNFKYQNKRFISLTS